MIMLDNQVLILERKKANMELPSQHLLNLIQERQSNPKASGSARSKRWWWRNKWKKKGRWRISLGASQSQLRCSSPDISKYLTKMKNVVWKLSKIVSKSQNREKLHSLSGRGTNTRWRKNGTQIRKKVLILNAADPSLERIKFQLRAQSQCMRARWKKRKKNVPRESTVWPRSSKQALGCQVVCNKMQITRSRTLKK